MDVPGTLVGPPYSITRLTSRGIKWLTIVFSLSSDVSRISDVTISAYLRTSPIVPGQNRNDMGNDLFLGGLQYVPST